ncbi:hypothetical protein [Desulfogranum marinum]|uniref:hypothetical protein n=1 Tax=Desulfogranum marinum TaxID=453220 RepID=UPI0029C70C9D|nr:hypothetical protein [Desulfogranum marinum]
MTLESTVCPHCGCRCEDDEYCAACGKLFDDDLIPNRTISLLEFLGGGLRAVELQPLKRKKFREQPEFDRTWTFLPSNIFHED